MAYCTDEEAVEIWKERWRGDFVHVIATKRGLNMFRVYEVFEEKMNVGSRLKAIEEFSSENPELAASTDFSPHKAKRRVVRLPDNDQMDMFGALKTAR